MATVLVICGVCGSGKSTVGAAVAAAVPGCAFADADDYHPPSNKAKMARGAPLSDADRAPWLDTLRALVARHLASRAPLVLACSALKAAYRKQLAAGVGGEGPPPTTIADAAAADGSGAAATGRAAHGATGGGVAFVLLDPPAKLLEARLAARAASGSGHFMPPSLLKSQLDALEVASRGDGSDDGGWLLIIGSGNGGSGGSDSGQTGRRLRDAGAWAPERIAEEVVRVWRGSAG